VERQADSPYADWYAIESFDDPATPADEFAWAGWAGVRELPEIRKVDLGPGPGGAHEGDLAPGAKEHIFAVTARWLDPDGDGDPSDGVDGFRLDVAELVPLGFWREWRAHVKSINPEALLVGEIWWEHWPLTMMDPAPWLEHAFDSVMHYRWYAPARRFLGRGEQPLSASALAAPYDSLAAPLPAAQRRALMWVAGSHDSPRVATSLANTGRYKAGASPRWTPDYEIAPPGPETLRRLELLRVLQCSLPGAPHIFAGDEFAMAGADDPDNRKPMPWPDLPRQTERVGPFGEERGPWDAGPNLEHLGFLQRLLALRAARLELIQHGERLWRLADDEARLLVWERRLGQERLLLAIHTGDEAATLRLEDEAPGRWRNRLGEGEWSVREGVLELRIEPLTALWLEQVRH
jgi:cyclomaltodextrinase / maltogenic alpha-amylase / neopullulanase